ncbi:MAG: phosphate ABC transporter permease subunit PstC [Dichotomicrobium sp.]
MLSTVLLTIIVLSAAGYVYGRRRAVAKGGHSRHLHSLPGYYGAYVAAWIAIPSLLITFIWLFLQDSVINHLLLATLAPERVEGLSSSEIDLLLTEIQQVAAGNIFGEPEPHIERAAQTYSRWQDLAEVAMLVAALSIGLIGLLITRWRITPEFRARQAFERVVTGVIVVCSIIAILTTLGIVLSLGFEAWRFFLRVDPVQFLTSLRWEPQIPLRSDQVTAGGQFGVIPVLTGTLLIAGIALLVAVPIGLASAIYLAEYANKRFRAITKPVIEILSGVPTVVYGFFAVLVVAPAMREFGLLVGLDIAPNSALAAGSVLGIMIIPFISSLSDDALAAVPQSLRDGAYAMGATRGETITGVLIPAALPGIVGGILLAASRAIGETMIVVMAAGIIARLTLNPLEPVTTVTVQIVTLLIGDTEFDNPKTLAAFALGLVLFLATLALNVIALRVVQKYREKYE